MSSPWFLLRSVCVADTVFDYRQLYGLFHPSLEKAVEQIKEWIGGDSAFRTSPSVWLSPSYSSSHFLSNPSSSFSTSPQRSPAHSPASSHHALMELLWKLHFPTLQLTLGDDTASYFWPLYFFQTRIRLDLWFLKGLILETPSINGK